MLYSLSHAVGGTLSVHPFMICVGTIGFTLLQGEGGEMQKGLGVVDFSFL